MPANLNTNLPNVTTLVNTRMDQLGDLLLSRGKRGKKICNLVDDLYILSTGYDLLNYYTTDLDNEISELVDRRIKDLKAKLLI